MIMPQIGNKLVKERNLECMTVLIYSTAVSGIINVFSATYVNTVDRKMNRAIKNEL
jgi:hypothetical protein